MYGMFYYKRNNGLKTSVTLMISSKLINITGTPLPSTRQIYVMSAIKKTNTHYLNRTNFQT